MVVKSGYSMPADGYPPYPNMSSGLISIGRKSDSHLATTPRPYSGKDNVRSQFGTPNKLASQLALALGIPNATATSLNHVMVGGGTNIEPYFLRLHELGD